MRGSSAYRRSSAEEVHGHGKWLSGQNHIRIRCCANTMDLLRFLSHLSSHSLSICWLHVADRPPVVPKDCKHHCPCQSPASHNTPPTPRSIPTHTLNTHHLLEACWNRVRGSKVGGDPETHYSAPPLFPPPFPYSFIRTLPLSHSAPPLCTNPASAPLPHSLSLSL